MMLSRTGASLYWLGRYLERADFIARLIEATVRLDVMSSRPAGEIAWSSALAVTETEEAFAASGAALRQTEVVRFLTLDTSHPGSVIRCLDRARDNAKAVRTALSREAWTAINRAWLVFENRNQLKQQARPFFLPCCVAFALQALHSVHSLHAFFCPDYAFVFTSAQNRSHGAVQSWKQPWGCLCYPAQDHSSAPT